MQECEQHEEQSPTETKCVLQPVITDVGSPSTQEDPLLPDLPPLAPISSIPRTIRSNANKRKAEDEFEIFASYIAAQLRLLPLENALMLQEKIQALVTKERIACMSEDTNKRLKTNDDMMVYPSSSNDYANVMSPHDSDYSGFTEVHIKEENVFDTNDSDSM